MEYENKRIAADRADEVCFGSAPAVPLKALCSGQPQAVDWSGIPVMDSGAKFLAAPTPYNHHVIQRPTCESQDPPQHPGSAVNPEG